MAASRSSRAFPRGGTDAIITIVAIALVVLLAVSALSGLFPPQAKCAADMCKEGREWLSTLLTLVVILGGLYQYSRAQRWKRAEWVAAATDGFLADRKVMNALYMLDWNRRRLPLLNAAPGGQPDFEFHEELLWTAFYSNSTIPTDVSTGLQRPFTLEEADIRDAFDSMLGGLERFETFIERGLITFRELQPYLEEVRRRGFRARLRNHGSQSSR